MRVHWLVGGVTYSNDKNLLKAHNLASVRLRTGALASAAKDRLKLSFGEISPDRSDALVIGKIGANDISVRESIWLDQISKMKNTGAEIVLDYTDDHLSFPSPMTSFYRRVLPFADICVTSSEVLQSSLSSKVDAQIKVIEDGIDVSVIPPRQLKETDNKNFLWFGHDTNLPYLISFLRSSGARTLRGALFIQTTISGVRTLKLAKLENNPGLSLHAELWSRSVMMERAKSCHFCLIPGDQSSEQKRGASANRLITALALGLRPIVTVLPSYEKFGQYLQRIEETSNESLDRVEKNWIRLLKNSQEKVIPNYSQESQGRNWLNLIESLVKSKKRSCKE